MSQLDQLNEAYDGFAGGSNAPVIYGGAGVMPIQTHGRNAIADMVDDDPVFDPADTRQIRQFVRFYHDPLRDEVMVEVRHPADETSILTTTAEPYHVRRWPKQWAAFQRQESDFAGQTMLTEVGWLEQGVAFALQGRGVMTLEMLAGVSDSNCDGLGLGGRQMRDRARADLARKAKLEEADGLEAALAAEKARNADLEERMAKLEAMMAGQTGQEPEKRGPGRPRKDET